MRGCVKEMAAEYKEKPHRGKKASEGIQLVSSGLLPQRP